MKLTIHLLGPARQTDGPDQVELEVPAGACVHDVLPLLLPVTESRLTALLADRGGKLNRSVLAILRDQVINPAEPDLLQEGDDLTLLPPMSGG